ncbi:MAG: hypothetical protein EXX96DRAFT_622448 [Benjaminiella poitrasii]|nr:MAG: hypothetical protein EXX96DRAFT_622448 [Benjaminiella poitrasii]
MNQFLFEDGRGNLRNEQRDHVHKPAKNKQAEAQSSTKADQVMIESDNVTKNTKRTYKAVVKKIYLIYEKNMSVRAAAHELKVPQSSAQGWKKKAELAGDDELKTIEPGSGRKAGRPSVFTEEHKEFVINFIDSKPSCVFDEMMKSLTSQFADLQIRKLALHEYVTKKCNITLKRAHFHAAERNSSEKIEERYN